MGHFMFAQWYRMFEPYPNHLIFSCVSKVLKTCVKLPTLRSQQTIFGNTKKRTFVAASQCLLYVCFPQFSTCLMFMF